MPLTCMRSFSFIPIHIIASEKIVLDYFVLDICFLCGYGSQSNSESLDMRNASKICKNLFMGCNVG